MAAPVCVPTSSSAIGSVGPSSFTTVAPWRMPSRRDRSAPARRRAAQGDERFPPGYHLVERRSYAGSLPTRVRVYARRASR